MENKDKIKQQLKSRIADLLNKNRIEIESIELKSEKSLNMLFIWIKKENLEPEMEFKINRIISLEHEKMGLKQKYVRKAGLTLLSIVFKNKKNKTYE